MCGINAPAKQPFAESLDSRLLLGVEVTQVRQGSSHAPRHEKGPADGEFGRDKINNQIWQTIGTMKACKTMDDFRQVFNRVFRRMPTQIGFDFTE